MCGHLQSCNIPRASDVMAPIGMSLHVHDDPSAALSDILKEASCVLVISDHSFLASDAAGWEVEHIVL